MQEAAPRAGEDSRAPRRGNNIGAIGVLWYEFEVVGTLSREVVRLFEWSWWKFGVENADNTQMRRASFQNFGTWGIFHQTFPRYLLALRSLQKLDILEQRNQLYRNYAGIISHSSH